MTRSEFISKRTYLEQVKYLDLKIKVNNDEIKRLESIIIYASPKIRDTTSKSNTSNKDDLLCKVMDLKAKIDEDITKLVKLKITIFDVINSIEDVRAKTLLTFRYLEFKTMFEISEEMNYSIQHLNRLHKAALSELIVNPNIIKNK